MVPDPISNLSRNGQIGVHFLIAGLALVLLERSVDLFLNSISTLSRRIGVPALLISLLTAGAEWEELAITISALLQKKAPLASGNIIGSCIANILGSFSLGLLCFKPATLLMGYDQVRTSKSTQIIYTSFLVALSVAVCLVAHFHAEQKFFGTILLVLFAAYVTAIGTAIYKGYMDQPEDSDADSDTSSAEDDASVSDASVRTDLTELPNEQSSLIRVKRKPRPPKEARATITRSTVLLISGTATLSLSGYLLAYSSSALARLFNIDQSVFGLTLLSIASTLPEKLLAVFAGKRGEFQILVAAAVGSNIFLLTVNMGILLLFDESVQAADLDYVVLVLATLWIWVLVALSSKRRFIGGLMLAAYVGYVLYTLIERSR